jgi:hypothetical protein
MYQFVFYFVYRAKINADGAKQTRYSASLMVMIFLGNHSALLYAILRFTCCFFGNSLLPNLTCFHRKQITCFILQ